MHATAVTNKYDIREHIDAVVHATGAFLLTLFYSLKSYGREYGVFTATVCTVWLAAAAVRRTHRAHIASVMSTAVCLWLALGMLYADWQAYDVANHFADRASELEHSVNLVALLGVCATYVAHRAVTRIRAPLCVATLCVSVLVPRPSGSAAHLDTPFLFITASVFTVLFAVVAAHAVQQNDRVTPRTRLLVATRTVWVLFASPAFLVVAIVQIGLIVFVTFGMTGDDDDDDEDDGDDDDMLSVNGSEYDDSPSERGSPLPTHMVVAQPMRAMISAPMLPRKKPRARGRRRLRPVALSEVELR